MIRCDGCGRHVREREPACPFCSGRLSRSLAAQRALQLVGGATTTVVLAACYGAPDGGPFPYPGHTGTYGGRPTPTGATTGTSTGTSTGPTTPTTDPCYGFSGSGTTQVSVSVAWVDVDGASPTDADGDGVNETDCSSDTVTVCVDDPLGVRDWYFGMAEAGAAGWTGEDCIGGAGSYDLCHAFGLPGVQLLETCTPAEVVPGVSTLLDAGKDPFLTYYLVDATGACFVFGADTAYYAGLGCTELTP